VDNIELLIYVVTEILPIHHVSFDLPDCRIREMTSQFQLCLPWKSSETVILGPSTENQLFPGIMSSERTEESQPEMTASHVGTAHTGSPWQISPLIVHLENKAA
jgi:hypothetical protein